MTFRSLVLFAAAMAAPLAAQPADTPRGTWLVYAEPTGLAFASREPGLAADGVWPLEFHYFDEGQNIGTARMVARPDCAAGQVRGRLTHVNGEALAEMPDVEAPEFTFDRAAGSGGDSAIVEFICRTGAEAAPAELPIARSIDATVALFRLLIDLGLPPRNAAQLVISDAEAAAVLAASLVPAAQRPAVLAALEADAAAEPRN